MQIELPTAFSLDPKGVEAPVSAQQRMMRKLQRLCCTTVSRQTTQRLQERADYKGRSLSNLMTPMLEVACPE